MASWRDTYKQPRFFIIDARIAYFMLPALLHVRWWTVLIVCIVASILFYFERRRGLHLAAAGRTLRWWLAGDDRPAVNPVKKRKMADYG